MKKIVFPLSLACTMLFAGTALAAPLTTYKPGSFAVGLDMKYSKLKTERHGSGSYSFDKDWAVNYDVEVGLAEKFALQINGLNDKADKTNFGGVDHQAKLQTVEAKVKYQLLKNDLVFLSAYTGLARNKLKNESTLGNWSTSHKTSGMVGLTGVVSLRPTDLKLYADLGLGNKTHAWDIGISYAVISNLELDLGYKYYKAKDLKHSGTKYDATSKGLYVGATLKF